MSYLRHCIIGTVIVGMSLIIGPMIVESIQAIGMFSASVIFIITVFASYCCGIGLADFIEEDRTND